jgi:hypothetical protein
MSRRRRRRERRAGAGEPVAANPDKRVARADEKRRADFELQQRSLARRRFVIGLLGFVPLLGALSCGWGVTALCAIPGEWWLAIWAALFGSYLGITIRLIIQRRRFQRGAAGG